MSEWNETVEIKRHHLDELRFYGFAGICVARFQQLDDHLQNPFAKLLTISSEQASIVFGSIRTVQRRCEVIAKLLEADRPDVVESWKSLTKRIRRAEDNRNSIAHGSPIFGGGVTTVQVDTETEKTEVLSQTESFFYLEKRGYSDWTTERLLNEARQTELLLSDLYAFCRSLGDKET